MESRQQWLTRLKNELSNSPLASNVAFGFILMGLEKLVELEFECPCNPTWNGVFSSAFFIIPAVMAFTLMLIIQGCRCDTWCRKSVSLSSFVPAIVWLILLFLDGQYFACAMTDWKGRFVLVDKAAPQKWCEPTSEGDVPPQELMLRSQQLFVVSQVIGIFLLIFICVGLVVYVVRESCHQEAEQQESNVAELRMLTVSSLRTRT
ncbi:calcium homeostasis modulator protein 6 [Osmerus eperlanus]|uniref:calcium homeostasis modulator protein 6 n=1 Tax=Osmerus eperlanus TaxID=29151 RepID=UPI002E0F0B1E